MEVVVDTRLDVLAKDTTTCDTAEVAGMALERPAHAEVAGDGGCMRWAYRRLYTLL